VLRKGEALTKHEANTGSANLQVGLSQVRMAVSYVAGHVDELRAVGALAVKVEVARHAREVLDGRDPDGAAAALLSHERVEQRRLADVRSAREGHLGPEHRR